MINQREEKAHLLKEAIAILAIVLLSFLFSLQADNNIWMKGNTWTDSSVFKYVARVMDQGGMPYQDTFDHKGPLIYLINVLGIKIAEWRGVWVFELFAIFGTFYFMYRIARLRVDRGTSILLLIIGGSSLFSYFEGGNFTEEYAMPFIAISLYIFTDYFLHGKITPLRLMACGFSFAAILMLRANMCAVWLVMCIGVLVQCVREKQYKELGRFVVFFLVGALVLLIPIFLWLIGNGAFQAFWEDYVVFNAKYSSQAQRASLENRADALVYFLDNGIVLFPVCSLFYTWYKKKTYFDLLHLICIGATLLLICISGRNYGHYGMILVPALIYPLAQIVRYLRDDVSNRALSAVLVICLFVSLAASGWLGAAKDAVADYAGKDETHFGQQEKEIAEMIMLHSAEDDKIIVMGNYDIIYNMTGRFAASKYSYQYSPLGVDAGLAEDFYQEMEENRPKVVVLPLADTYGAYGWMRQYIERNRYYEIGKTSNQKIAVYGRPD